MRGIPPPALDLTPTPRRKGTGDARKLVLLRAKRLNQLIEAGGLLPGEHDDFLGIVRMNKGEVAIHRHTAAESRMPLDVQADYERVRIAIAKHANRKSESHYDPLGDYAVEGRPGYYMCPICARAIKDIRPLIRHIEGQSHLNIIYLCNFEPGPTTKDSCTYMKHRASDINKHLQKCHKVDPMWMVAPAMGMVAPMMETAAAEAAVAALEMEMLPMKGLVPVLKMEEEEDEDEE